MSFYTPLRYPGGKGKLAPFIQKVFLHNHLMQATYVEPYSGGAGLALALLFNGYAKKIIINDLDYSIFAFWKTVIDEPEWLCSRIITTPINMDSWYEQREINAFPFKYSLKEVGFSTFFMNRTNRSGIIKGGVIGGKNQNGPYKINARFNKDNLITRINNISKRKKDISVYNDDALSLAKKIITTNNRNIVFYFDPPYFHKSKTLYQNSYNESDHKVVADFIQKLPVPWIVTYDNVPKIRELYKSSPSTDLTINYSAYRNAIKGNEVLFYGNLTLPTN